MDLTTAACQLADAFIGQAARIDLVEPPNDDDVIPLTFTNGRTGVVNVADLKPGMTPEAVRALVVWDPIE